MKSIILTGVILLAIVSFASYKKEKQNIDKQTTLSGEWYGQYSLDDGPLANDMVMVFKSDDDINFFNGAKEWGDKGVGTYETMNKDFSVQYKFVDGIQDVVCMKGHLNDSVNRIEGEWKWISGSGKFVLIKKPIEL